MNLIDVVHHVVQQVLAAYQLTDYCAGTVKQTSPLEVEVNPQMAPLRASVLIMTEGVRSAGFQVGDRLIMLKVQRGQKFIILGKA